MKYLLTIIFISTIFSCSNLDFNCDYRIVTHTNALKPTDTTVVDTIPTINAISYGYYIDTALIKINSYEDAEKGIVTMVSNDSEIKYDIKGIWDSDKGECILAGITKEDITIVVCDPTTKSYAYRVGNAAKGLNEVVVSLLFMPWKITPETPTYNQSKWIVSKELENGILID